VERRRIKKHLQNPLKFIVVNAGQLDVYYFFALSLAPEGQAGIQKLRTPFIRNQKRLFAILAAVVAVCQR
jgi:hypothetical protein